MSWHCSSIQSIFACFMPFLISWLTALYCLIPSASFFFFFNSLRLSHRSSKSAVTQGFLTERCVPRISLAVLVTAVLKVLINVSMSVPSASRMVSAASFPPFTAWKAYATSGSFSFSRSNLILVWPSFLTLFRCSLKFIMTSSWSLPISAPIKLRVLAMFTLDRKRFSKCPVLVSMRGVLSEGHDFNLCNHNGNIVFLFFATPDMDRWM